MKVTIQILILQLQYKVKYKHKQLKKANLAYILLKSKNLFIYYGFMR